MRPSKKMLRIIVISVFILIFISISIYRYQEVNRPYKNYSVIETIVQPEQGFPVGELIFTFKKPTIKEESEQIYYEIPLIIEGENTDILGSIIDRFIIRSNRFNNQLNLDLFLAHPKNQERDKKSRLSNSSDEIVLTFTMQKEWGINYETKADLYFLVYQGGKMIKHKLPLNY